MDKKLVFIFVLSFVLNLVWEYLHSTLYAFYQHGLITLPILLRAALFDAIVITFLYIIFSKHAKIWVPVSIALIFAVVLELYALKTGRWEYNNLMPIIPFLNVGLTPVLQLPVLYYLVIKITELKNGKRY
jgi:phosphate starvation-inducible membrane PsiE